MRAYILIDVDADRTIEAQTKLAAMRPKDVDIRMVDIVAGDHDIIMVVESNNPSAIGDVILDTLHNALHREITGIRHTTTLFQLRAAPVAK